MLKEQHVFWMNIIIEGTTKKVLKFYILVS